MNDIPQLMTTEEKAAQLAVSVKTMKRWRKRGIGPKAIKFAPRVVRYRADDFGDTDPYRQVSA